MPKSLILFIFFASPTNAQELLKFGETKQNFSVSSGLYSSRFDQSGSKQPVSSRVKINSDQIKSKLSKKLHKKIFSGASDQLELKYDYQLNETKYNAETYYGLLPNLTVGLNLAVTQKELSVSQNSKNISQQNLSPEELGLLSRASRQAAKINLLNENKNYPAGSEKIGLGDIKLLGIYNPNWGRKSINLLGELTLPSGKTNDNYELIQAESNGKFSFGLGFVLTPFQVNKFKAKLKLMSRINFDQDINLSVYDNRSNYVGEDDNVTINQGIENQIDLELSRRFFKSYNLSAGITYFERAGAKVEGAKYSSEYYKEYLAELYTSFQSYSLELNKAFTLFNNKTAVSLKYQNVFRGINIYNSQLAQLGISYFY